MGEINYGNFEENFSDIKRSLESAKFIAVDLEFSALHPLKNQQPSLFDNPSERYIKLRNNVELVIPLQIGLTAFSFDPKLEQYSGTIYNFYISPATFPSIERSFLFQSSSLGFLKQNNFDFNKFMYSGVPYLNEPQAKDLLKRLRDGSITDVQSNFGILLEEVSCKEEELLKNWFTSAIENEKLILTGLYEKYKTNFEVLYFIHKSFRSKFKNLWTCVEDNEFVVKKLNSKQFTSLSSSSSLEEELVYNLMGFTKVFRLLTSLKKPLVGHNILHDLVLMHESFYEPLPESYNKFKKSVHNLFPYIFDTKNIYFELNKAIPEEKRCRDRGLGSLFEYFKDGVGRHLAMNSPAIEAVNNESYGRYHEAGWDSFCAGYIFVRLAYFNIYYKFPKSKRFVSSELIGGLSEWKNRVNVIRGSVPYISIDGDDPSSTRPPYLVVESVKRNPVNISQVTTILSSFGFVEVRKIPHQNRRALVAVDNFGNARRILNNFKNSKEFSVKHYSTLKHSPIVRAILMGSLTISGVIILWITHSTVRK